MISMKLGFCRQYRVPYRADKGRHAQNGQLAPIPVEVDGTLTDKLLLSLECSLLAMRLLEPMRRIADEPTLVDLESVRSMYLGPDGGFRSEAHRTAKVCSDVLAVVEFYMNRYSGVSDDLIHDYMVVPRHTLAHLTGYRVRESPPIRDCPLAFNRTEAEEVFTFRSELFTEGFGWDFREGRSDADERMFHHISQEGGARGFAPFFEAALGPGTPSGTDIYVLLDGEMPDEVLSAYERYWTDSGREGQLGASRRYMPLTELMEVLTAAVDDVPERFIGLRYTVDRDIRDMGAGLICPLDAFLGRIRDRDANFETSESSLTAIHAADPELIRYAALYSRALHSLLMDTVETRSGLELHFTSRCLARLADPVSFDRSYPAPMVFTESAKGVCAAYSGALADCGYTRDGHVMVRPNADSPLAPDWRDVGKGPKSRMLRERRGTKSRLTLASWPPDEKVWEEAVERGMLFVSSADRPEEAEQAAASLGCTRNVGITVLYGTEGYVSVRHDIPGTVEVGVPDILGLYLLHRNGLDARREAAVDRAIRPYEADVGLDPDISLRGRLDAAESSLAGDRGLMASAFREYIRAVRAQMEADAAVRDRMTALSLRYPRPPPS